MNTKIKQIISLIDLTSLNHDDTEHTIIALCQQAQTPLGPVAAVCVYPKFVALAKAQLAKTNIKIATVVNFPDGKSSIEQVLKEITDCLANQADEIDVVIPYHELKNNNAKAIHDFVSGCKQACGDTCLKVILETGELVAHEISEASRNAISGGANFLKTSTGKVAVNATTEASEIMLLAIKDSGKDVGLKISGGVRTLEQAEKYIDQATRYMSDEFISAKTFRFGASSLLDNLLAANKT